MWLPIGGPL